MAVADIGFPPSLALRLSCIGDTHVMITQAALDDGDYMASMMAMWMTPFMPNLLNTSVFLVAARATHRCTPTPCTSHSVHC